MSTNNTPTFFAYSVKEFGQGKTKKTKWTRIGAAWSHSDGEGFSIELDALPLDGKIVLRQPKKDGEETAGQLDDTIGF
ncbi:hypothetical protein LMG28614_05656 [Paraburkholderia ultramafica]|uniref:DUF736 domain-containing protein n=1 Tax=Paraburkholderia ultramafica TaxID=1544867 RepID=A0A6S7BY20_9BURK|nr:hypothetical protein [Paraburkholderia ultramafica]CAB3802608.1 hypothetical protein LMG28614_05656 [Paraburkholderia ultramafica]